MKLKIGDEVETEHGVGVITFIKNKKHHQVKVKCGMFYWYVSDELKLLPKFKTLAQLWEENDRRPFKAVCGQVKIFVFGICYCERPDALYLRIDEESEGYQDILADQAKWQLYQEPEEEPTVKKSLSVEKCEHKNVKIIRNMLKPDTWSCKDCDNVELVEKWLWIYNIPTSGNVLFDKYLTEAEAIKTFGDDLIKKATNSRELFEVGNEKLD